MLTIRQEQLSDTASISRVHQEAFSHRTEADLVERLRTRGKFKISLTAEIKGQVVGHILFTEVNIKGSDSGLSILGLAPMAVLPEFQRRGVGSELIRRGLGLCQESGHDVVVVVGHPEYYPRFGFVPASRYGLRCEYDVPDDVFMALELRAGALRETSGLVRYQPEFADSDGIADG